VTLKPHKPKENGTAKGKEVSNSGKAKQAKVSPNKSPIKSPNTTSKPSVKSSQPIVSTKVTPTPPKLKPTSVMAFFGSSSVQRSEKKMVASTSTKRKAVSRESESKCVFACALNVLKNSNSSVFGLVQPTQEIDESLSDEAIAKELQMDEDIEVGFGHMTNANLVKNVQYYVLLTRT